MSKQQRSGCSPRFETLEQKQLLAGDVTYEVVNGNLHLLGDAESNEIVITAGDIEGSYLVQGLNGTTISPADGGDGSAAPVSGFVVEGVTRNVRIDLGDGDDTVYIHDADFQGNLSIATGLGEDTVNVGVAPPVDPSLDPAALSDEAVGTDASVSVRRSLLIATGDDADTVLIEGVQVRGNISIATGDGADSVQIGGQAAEESTEEVSTDATTDESAFDASVTARHGIHVNLGAGEDSLAVQATSAAFLRATGGADTDTLSVVDSRFRLLHLSGGIGEANDEISLSGVHAHIATLHTSGGADTVSVQDSAFALLSADLGAGDDSLSVSGVTARWARLNGGTGDADTLELGENEIGLVRAVNFELPEPTETSANEGARFAFGRRFNSFRRR